MRTLYDFPGGIHPPENKRQSSETPIRIANLPERLIIPLQQHIGAPARTRVSEGDRVLKGDVLGDTEGAFSVPVHAPTSGHIERIGPHAVPHPSGLDDWCVTLIPDGKDHWGACHPLPESDQQDPDRLLAHIHKAGIAGLGGAGFPTGIKLRPPETDSIRTVILNAAECEPYITADDRLIRDRAAEVVSGLQIVRRILNPEQCLIGIEDNKPDAIQALESAVDGTGIEVVVIPTRYPSGGEKQLIQVLTGEEVPHGGIPADIGVLCQNVGTAAAIHRAVYHGEPLIQRITTLTGDALCEPGNVETLIGTPIRHLLDSAGFDEARAGDVLMGGPMMGFSLPDLAMPVVKTTNCLLAGSPEELPPPPPPQPCIRCGYCADACPMELLPQQLFWFAQSGENDKAEQHNLFDCIECGACSWVCPSQIPLVQYYRSTKGEIREQREEQIRADRARERFEARQARLEREQAEKEAKRQARKEAAAKARQTPPASKAAPERSAAASETVAAPSEAPDIETLEKQLLKAQAKRNNMRNMLDDARKRGADNVDKLEKAVAKNDDRVDAAQKALEKARSGLTETGGATE
ncbi:electron transport complex protein RnfC [Tamilnaduibacter salinus]|uniref:Ion-translocating oxidoreductase complex subunit C n=1 Tax=Tamilnaduibacter salinus TaxID=1484056 RepID=A0A2U1CT71_9GAMM|nr:electron transport complex subunit RsxC [Tamilnaduibacter salinus]PVY69635.1 electron transport complex protein RnfC [Tamilnaduibacter salinus]